VLEHLHPLGAEELEVALLVALRAVDGRDLDPADAHRAICSSCCVRLAASTALPGHHQRVHGLCSRVMAGQSRSDAAAAEALADG
jgi:hypothetical protein